MAEARNIETLSVLFTAGVVAGTLVPGPFSGALAGALLPLLALPVLFRRRLSLLPSGVATGLILGIFALLGFFCALSAAQSVIQQDGWLSAVAQSAVQRLRGCIEGIPFPSPLTAPLLKAFLTGDRSSLPADTVAIFRSSGASHLLALSGLHIGILYLLMDKLSALAGRSPAARVFRAAGVVMAAGFFTLMCGATPSLVRAFLFILISESLRLTGRPRKPVRVLCLALLLQLVLDPAAIRSIGFQLSYLAMAGIFLLYPLLDSWFPDSGRTNPMRRIWQAAALSISCQLFTAPLVWFRFHTFPRFFLLTNLMAIPLTTGLMYAAVGTVFLAALGYCPDVLIQATDGLCRLLLWVLETIASL